MRIEISMDLWVQLMESNVTEDNINYSDRSNDQSNLASNKVI